MKSHVFTPREIVSVDPQHRLALEVSWEALEDAGIAPDRLEGSRTGVFLGLTYSEYLQLQLEQGGLEGVDAYMGPGNCANFAAGRISYFLGVHGPCMAVDAACASSLVTVHLACQSLRSGESAPVLERATEPYGLNIRLTPPASASRHSPERRLWHAR